MFDIQKKKSSMQLTELPLLSAKGMLQFKKHQSSRSLIEYQVPSGADQITHANIFLRNPKAIRLK